MPNESRRQDKPAGSRRRVPRAAIALAAIIPLSAVGLGAAYVPASATAVQGAPAAAAPRPSDPNAAALQHTQELQRKAPVNKLIVKYTAGTDAAQADGQATGTSDLPVEAKPGRKLQRGYRTITLSKNVSPQKAQRLADKLAQDPRVASASPVTRFFPTDALAPAAAPNDSYFDYQWDLESYGALGNALNSTLVGMQAQYGWAATTGAGAAPTIAVLDTGKTSHPDLNNEWVSGYDFISNSLRANDGNGRDPDPSDPGDWVSNTEATDQSSPYYGCTQHDSSWHGTHVAGTIGAQPDNNAGIAGIVWGAKIMPVRVLGKCGGDSDDIADAITWASGGHISGVPDTTTPAKVLNLSLGGDSACDSYTQSAIDGAVARGSTVVVAAGNSNEPAAYESPANCNNVISVAALDRYGYRAVYSNYGSSVDIAAPGGGVDGDDDAILSTWNSGLTSPGAPGYDFKSGTSMAAPHVAGAVALYLAQHPTASEVQVLRALQASATAFPAGNLAGTGQNYRCVYPQTCGAGMLNLAGLLNVNTPPGPPVGVSAAVTSDSQVTINLTPAPGVTYTSALYGATLLAGSAIGTDGLQTLTVPNLSTVSSVLVTPFNASGAGAAVEVPLSRGGMPGTPGLSTSATKSSIHLGWSGPSAGSSAIQGYRVRIDGIDAYDLNLSTRSFDLTGLAANQNHTVSVWAYNLLGVGAPATATVRTVDPKKSQAKPKVATRVKKNKSFTVVPKTKSGQKLKIKSSNSVCKVTRSGGKWTVKGKKKGTCVLTLTAPGTKKLLALTYKVKVKVT